ncbi:hypothetical protein MMC13_002723 [Lambiella insularis]|nr:hypothetical protein [Lambiella insularis]
MDTTETMGTMKAMRHNAVRCSGFQNLYMIFRLVFNSQITHLFLTSSDLDPSVSITALTFNKAKSQLTQPAPTTPKYLDLHKMSSSPNMAESAAPSICGPADHHSPFACAQFGKTDCLKYCWVLSPNGMQLFEFATQEDPEAKQLRRFLSSRIHILESLEDLEHRIVELGTKGQPVPTALADEFVGKINLAHEYNHAMHALEAAGKGPWVRAA